MPPQFSDISAALAYQVKKEIAENYFGSRKILEEERDDLARQKRLLEKKWEETILSNLTEIYRLLNPEEGLAFLDLIKRIDLLDSIKRNLRVQEIHPFMPSCSLPFALTVKGKYKGLVFSLYRTASTKDGEIRKEFHELEKKVNLFNEDLAKFTSCYHLSDILSLIHSFENRDDLKGVLGENTDPRAIHLLEEKMMLKPFDLCPAGPVFPRPLPPMKEIQTPLKLLIDLAFHACSSEIKKMLTPL